jgi:ATP-binding cassette subfamily B protein
MVLALAAVLLAGLGVVEAVVWRGVIDLGRDLGLVSQRLVAVALIAALTAVLLGLEGGLGAGLARLGRRLEVRLRLAFAAKVPRLVDRYFQSRPISDMAQRAHGLARVRDLPLLAGQAVQTAAALVLTAAAIAWFDPPSAGYAIGAAVAALVIPLAFRPWLTEMDLRLQTHAGALSRFTFDALQGLLAVRAHSGEGNVLRELEALLVEWLRTARRYLAGVLLLEGVQSLVGIALAGWLLLGHVGRMGDTGGALLLAYWALSLPALGGRMAALLRQYPWQRNTLLRALEPLGALEDPPPAPGASAPAGGGAELHFDNVTVRAAGQVILQELLLHVRPGEHLAIVGPSGAGKSSLFGVLLGWHRPAAGAVLVDGRPLDPAGLDALRAQTAWVDPAVQLWNRPLADNLVYGRAPGDAGDLGTALHQADLLTVLDRLPDGLQTPLGEGGGLLSGGQGQRVRVGRALLHPSARLVLLDEPFRGLERSRRRELTARAREHWVGRTLLLVTHDVEDTLDFGRVLVLADGQIVEDGPPQELATHPGSCYRELLDAERALAAGLWADPMWRRLRLDGELSEESHR